MKHISLFLLFFVLFLNNGISQLVVNGGLTATQLAEILAGPDITVSGATLSGDAVASGSFDGSSSNIGLSSGVILCTGNISQAVGPNNSASSGTNLNEPGTAQMTDLAGANTYDAITLEFSFEVQSEMIQFSYVFASEEYPEYAPPNSSSYNDVFAFYISGPGIVGEENIALIPSTSDVVSINNINAVTNNMYYIDNTGGTSVQFDAFTTELVARKDGLIPCETYTLKLVIADAGDEVYNSAVFLQENSLIQGVVNVQTQTINADDIALEGCVDASFAFTLDQTLSYDYIIDFTIAGSATNGIDFEFIDNSVTIPAGETSATIIIQAIQDGFAEGQEEIYLIYKPEICSGFDTATLYIDDAVPIQFSIVETNLGCFDDNSGEIFVDATGGFPAYSYYITDELGQTTIYGANPVTGLAAGIYSVQVYDTYGCRAEALVIGGLYDAGVTFLPDGSGVTYNSTINISGFDPGQTLDDISMLQQICATMEHSYLGDLQIRITSPTGQSVILKQFAGGGSTDLGEPVATGPVDGSAGSAMTDPGIGYEYCFNDEPDYLSMVDESYTYQHTYIDNLGHNLTDYYLPAGSYVSYEPLTNLLGSLLNGVWTISVTDQYYLDNGYIFNWNISLVSDLPDTIAVLTQPEGMIVNGFVTMAQCGGNDGAININVNGNLPPFSYLWSNGAITEDISGLASGGYTVTVTDDAGCFQTETYLLNNISSINTSYNISHIICNGGTEGAVALTTSGGTSPYSFNWNTGATSESISNLPAGSYQITITDDSGCEYLQSFSINQNPIIVVSTVSLQNEICSNDNGYININTTGGTGSYGYLWSNGATTQNLSNLPYGSYTVTVTDGNGCFSTKTVSLINDVSNCSSFCFLNISNTNIISDICGSGIGAIDITIEDVTFPYVINWSNGSSSEDISNLSFGDYTVTINDANNCELIQTITVANATGTLEISDYTVSNEICGNSLGEIEVTVSGGSLPYSYSWSNGSFVEDIAGLDEGIFSLTVTDGNNCILSESFVVENNTGNLIVSSSVTNDICNSGIGSISQTVTGAFGLASYNWSTGATSSSLSGQNAGTYYCTISDEAGCSTVKTYFITNSPGNMNLASTVVNNETCNNNSGSINITIAGGGGGYSYDWSTGATTEDISDLNEGIYSCTITDINTCFVHTGSIYVFNDAGNLEVNTQFITNEICGNQNAYANIDVTGGDGIYTYLWSNGSTNQDLMNVHAGNYTLTVTDGNGCVNQHNISIGNTASDLGILSNLITDESCGNSTGKIDLTIGGGTSPVSYLWNTGATSQDLINISEGNYSCTISDVNGCEINYSGIVENNTNSLDFSFVVSSELCNNGAGYIDLDVVGGTSPYSFDWDSGQNSEDISGLSGGTYSCEITDDNGCIINTGDIFVNNNPGSLAFSTFVVNEICGNGLGVIDITYVDGTTPLEYLWSGGETTDDISDLNAGSYQCTITDANNCEIIISATVFNLPGTLLLNSSSVTNENCNDNNGAIDITVSGGSLPLIFLWSSSETTEDISGLSEGNYSCTITDDDGCEIISNTYVIANNPGTLALNNIVVTDENCSNGLGKVNITVSGGAAPIGFLWSNGAITEDLLSLNSGIYSCTITDNNGCQLVVNSSVGNNTGTLNVNNSIVSHEICNNNDGEIDLSVLGGTIPYSYLWNSGQTSQDISGLSQGDYACQITDNNGCIISFETQILDLGSDMDISNSSISNEMCGNNAGSVNITLVGGIVPYSFIWSNGSIFEDLSNVSAGNYSLTVSDYNGCSISENFVVGHNTGSLVFVSVSGVDETCGDSNGSIDITYSGGFIPITFNWNNGATTEDLENIAAGNYNITITDMFGCYVTGSQIISNLSSGFELDNLSFLDEFCADGLGQIDLTIVGGLTPYSFLWSNGAITEDITGLSAGNYLCTITDANNCKIYAGSTIVNQTTGVAISGSFTQNETCNNGVGFIDQTISGGTSPYTYLWSTGANTQDLLSLHEGDYSCSISDNSGCVVIGNYSILNQGGDFVVNSDIQDEICTNSLGFIDISLSGGIPPYTYFWSGGELSQDIYNLSAGSYYLTIVDDVGCDFTSSYEIIQEENVFLGFQFVSQTNESCGHNNGVVGVNPLVPGSYTYSLSGNSPSTLVPYPQWTDLSAGDYLVSISDINGCYLDSLVHIINSSPYSINISHIVDDNCGNGEGAIDISVSPSGEYLFNWSNGATSEDIYDLFGGIYSCTFTDETGCISYFEQEILNVTSISADASTVDEYCGDAQGSIDLNITGGSSPFTFIWSNGETSEDIQYLSAGEYFVTATDNSGCAGIYGFSVNNNTGSLELTSTVNNDNCFNGIGAVNISVTGGSGNYAYGWSNGSDTEDISGLFAGVYELVLFDLDLNCRITEDFEVENNTAFEVTFTQVTDILCGEFNSGAITIYVYPSAGSYSYIWNNGETSQNLSDISAGNYSVTITDLFGCDEILFFVVNSETDMTSSAIAINENCGNGTGSVDLSVFGGTSPYEYIWSNGNSTQDLFDLNEGVYSCTISDNLGCITIQEVIIENDSDLSGSSIVTDESCGDNQGSVDISVSGGTLPYEYLWSNGSTSEDIESLAEGNYLLSVTDANGCLFNFDVSVINNTGTLDAVGYAMDDYCFNSNGYIDIEVSGGSGNYLYDWSNGQTSQDIGGLTQGTYSVVIYDVDLNCRLTRVFEVNNSGSFSIVSDLITDASCISCDDGSIEIGIYPSGSYTFIWSNGANLQNISDVLPGLYTVTIENSVGCVIVESFEVGFLTNMTSANTTVIFNVYPNPSTGVFNLKIDGEFLIPANYFITDLLGRKIQQGVIDEKTTSINLEDSKAGFYYLIIDGNKVIKLVLEQ